MTHDFVFKKLEQLSILLKEIEEVLSDSYTTFSSQFQNIRTAERNLQLVVELASDINAHLVSIKTGKIPDTYKLSFRLAKEIGLIDEALEKVLSQSATLRNILVHEYDFDSDNYILYKDLEHILPAYKEYIKAVAVFVKGNSNLE